MQGRNNYSLSDCSARIKCSDFLTLVSYQYMFYVPRFWSFFLLFQMIFLLLFPSISQFCFMEFDFDHHQFLNVTFSTFSRDPRDGMIGLIGRTTPPTTTCTVTETVAIVIATVTTATGTVATGMVVTVTTFTATHPTMVPIGTRGIITKAANTTATTDASLFSLIDEGPVQYIPNGFIS